MADFGTVDTSIYNQPQGNSLMQNLQGYQGLANAGLQNQLMRQQQQLNQQSITQQQAQTYNAKLGLISQELATVYGADNGNPTRQHILDGISNLMSENPGMFDNTFAANVIADMNRTLPTDAPPAMVKQWALSHIVRTEQARGMLQPFLPNAQPVNTGPNVTYNDVNPITNPGIVGGKTAMGMSPETASEPTPIGSGMGTRQQYATATQGAGPAPGTFTPGPGGSPAPGATPLASIPVGRPAAPAGVPMPPPRPADLASASPAASAAAAQPAGLVAAPAGVNGHLIPVGSSEAASKEAQAGADQANALAKAAEDVPNQKSILSTMQDQVGKFQSGAFAGPAYTAKSAVNYLEGMVGKSPSFEDSTAAQDIFRKNAIQLASQQSGALGSDARLDALIHGNPNETMQPKAMREVLAMLQGRQDAIQFKNEAWQQYQKENGGKGANYQDFASQFNKSFDPRAFAVNYLKGDDLKDFASNLSQGERNQITAARQFARQRGFLK